MTFYFSVYSINFNFIPKHCRSLINITTNLSGTSIIFNLNVLYQNLLKLIPLFLFSLLIMLSFLQRRGCDEILNELINFKSLGRNSSNTYEKK